MCHHHAPSSTITLRTARKNLARCIFRIEIDSASFSAIRKLLVRKHVVEGETVGSHANSSNEILVFLYFEIFSYNTIKKQKLFKFVFLLLFFKFAA